MSDAGSSQADDIKIRISQVIAVGQDRVWSHQTKTGQCIGVRAAETFERVLMFPIALGAVRLHPNACLDRQSTEPGENFIATGRSKTGGNDGLNEWGTQTNDLFDGGMRGRDRSRSVDISVPLGRAGRMVHGDPADEGSLAKARAGGGKHGRSGIN